MSRSPEAYPFVIEWLQGDQKNALKVKLYKGGEFRKKGWGKFWREEKWDSKVEGVSPVAARSVDM